MCQVHAITIYFILLQPIFKHTVEEVASTLKVVVPILKHIVAMRRRYVEIWIFSKWQHLVLWCPTCSMIEHHIHNDCNTTFVAFVNQLFERVDCAIRLVESEIVGRIVTP